MTDKTPARPELPEPELGYIETDKSRQPAFSARQMREALQSAQPAAPGVTGAVQTLIETLKADPAYAWAWHCNVAMAAVDEGLSHYAANKAAARFLSWLAQIDTTTHPGFPKAPAQPAAAVSDGEIVKLAFEMCSACYSGMDHQFAGMSVVKFARAILALRPERVPMTENQVIGAALYTPPFLLVDYLCVVSFEAGVRSAEAHHGITQRADGGEQQS